MSEREEASLRRFRELRERLSRNQLTDEDRRFIDMLLAKAELEQAGAKPIFSAPPG